MLRLFCCCCCCALVNVKQLADACSNAEEQQAQVAAAREEVHAVLAAREQRCKDLRAEVSMHVVVVVQHLAFCISHAQCVCGQHVHCQVVAFHHVPVILRPGQFQTGGQVGHCLLSATGCCTSKAAVLQVR